MVYKYDYRCKKCGHRFVHHNLIACPECGSFGVEIMEWTGEFKFHCSTCGIGFDKSSFGLTTTCDKCYRKIYAKTKANYKASGHFYPWTIDGRLRKPPVRRI